MNSLRITLRCLVGLALIALFASLVFVLHHRMAARWPESGDLVRRTARPGVELEVDERESSVATLLELRNDAGAVTTAWLRVPRELEAGYEILITYVGHRTGRRLLDLVPERNDVVLLAMQYAAEYRNDTWSEKLALPRTIREAVHDTVAGGMLAVGELKRRGFAVDRLTVLGVSVGGFFAVLHGAYDEAVPRVLIVHGGGDLRRVLSSLYESRGQPWKGRWVGAVAWLFLDRIDAIHHVDRIAPRSFAMIASRGDAYFPEESAALLYARADVPKAISWTAGDHVRSRRPDIIEDLVKEIDAYLDGEIEFDEVDLGPVSEEAGARSGSSSITPVDAPRIQRAMAWRAEHPKGAP